MQVPHSRRSVGLTSRAHHGQPFRLVGAFALTLAFSIAPLASSSAQVTVFDEPPSVEALRDALTGAAKHGAGRIQSASRSRGIVWKRDASVPAQQPAPAAGLPIQFALGSADVNELSHEFIDVVAQLLREDRSMSLLIEGHTDATGGLRRNMQLSWQRAMSVYEILVGRHGVDPSRLEPIGKGPSEPLRGLLPVNGKNRRVQFRLKG